MKLTTADVFEINRYFFHFQSLFPDNKKPLNYFLATCFFIDSTIDPEHIKSRCPYGGIIGINNSKLHCLLKRFKMFRLHAALHDAGGYMKRTYHVGPGYIYALDIAVNSCFLGHLSGLAFCAYLKYFHRRLFNNLLC